MQQVRLDRSWKFKCSECRKTKTARLVALVDDDWERLVCNGCYGQLRAEGRLPRLANRGVPAGGDPVEPEVASRDRTEGRRAQEASAPAAVPQTRGPVDGATVSIVEVEAKYAATPFHVAEANEREAERREAELVERFVSHLRSLGHVVGRLRIRPNGEDADLYSDILDETAQELIEAKGGTSRSHIRMAIGQLADYSRFAETNVTRAVLVPECPSDDLMALLASQGIDLIFPRDDGWHRSEGSV